MRGTRGKGAKAVLHDRESRVDEGLVGGGLGPWVPGQAGQWYPDEDRDRAEVVRDAGRTVACGARLRDWLLSPRPTERDDEPTLER